METRRLLLIDSDNEFKDLLNAQLAPYGFEVSAVSPEDRDPLSLVTELAPEAVFIAVELPNKFGYSLCNKAKKGVAREIPVILTTKTVAPSGFQSHRKLKAHADEYIDKRDMTEDELISKLNQLIGLGIESSAPASDGFELEVEDVEVEEIEIGDSGGISIETSSASDDLIDLGGSSDIIELDSASAEIDFAFESLTVSEKAPKGAQSTTPKVTESTPVDDENTILAAEINLDALESSTIQTDVETYLGGDDPEVTLNPADKFKAPALVEEKRADLRAQLDKMRKPPETARPIPTAPALARTPAPVLAPKSANAPAAGFVRPVTAPLVSKSTFSAPQPAEADEFELEVSMPEPARPAPARAQTSDAFDDLARQAQAQLEKQRQDLEQEKKRALDKVAQKHAHDLEALKLEHSEELEKARSELARVKEEQNFQVTAARQAETVRTSREHQAEVARLNEAHQKGLAELKQELEAVKATQAAQEDQHGQELAELNESHSIALAEVEAKYGEEKKRAAAESMSAADALKKEHATIVSALEDKLAAKNGELASAQKEFQTTQAALDQSRSRIQELEAAVAQKDQELRTRSQELANLTSEFNEKINEVVSLKADLAARDADSEAKAKEFEERTSELEATARDLSACKAEIGDLQDQVKELETTLASATQDLTTDKFAVEKAKKALAIALTLLDDCPAGATDSDGESNVEVV